MSVFDVVYQDPRYYPRPASYLCARLRPDLSGQTVLDLGCGNGRNAMEVLRRGGTVIASDPSEVGIEALIKQADVDGFHPRLHATVEALPTLAVESLDGVVLSTVLDHMDRGAAVVALDAIGKALKPTAWIYTSAFTVDDPGRLGQSTSETNSEVVTYWEPVELVSEVTTRLGARVMSLSADWMIDRSHGPEHLHHLLRLFAVRGEPNVRRVVD